MKTKLIFILFFSSFFSLITAQKKDSATVKKNKYEPNFMVGVDVVNAGIGLFSERKLFQGFISSRINKNIHAVVDAGYDKNIYDKNGYDAKASGVFVKMGGFYMMAMDAENHFNGFYLGSKIAGSFYNQEYRAIPVRGSSTDDASVAFPATNQSSYWLEAMAGSRIALFNSDFYIDVNVQPRYLLYTTKQDGIYPMIVPGFGRSSGKFNMGFSWSIAYKF